MFRNLKCIIVEDEEVDRLVLQHHLKRFENIIIVESFDSAEKALPKITSDIDLIFLDIDLPGISGIEFRKMIQEVPACIFISSHPEYAIDTFELDTLDFITKPLKLERFNYSMQKLFDFFEMREKSDRFDAMVGENHIKMKDGGNILQIKISDILYLEALKDYARIITSEKKHCILDSIGNLLLKKDFGNFVRIHRSFAIPKHQIKSKNAQEVELSQKIKLPIGRAYKGNLDFFSL